MRTISDPLDEQTVYFEFPATINLYAPNIMTLVAPPGLLISVVRPLLYTDPPPPPGVQAALPTGAVVEAWLLKKGGNYTLAADYVYAFNILSGVLLFQASSLYARAIQFRGKSGGTAGALYMDAAAV